MQKHQAFWQYQNSKNGRPRSGRTQQNISKAKKMITKNVSQRKLAKQLNTSKSNVQRILNLDLQLKPYKIRRQPFLQTAHIEKRLKFSYWVQNNFTKNDCLKILFSDEKQFEIDGVYNTQNDRIGAVDRAQADLKGGIFQKQKFPQKVMVWIGVSSRGLSPLVFLPKGGINSQIYIDQVLPVSKKFGDDNLGEDWIYQQDGATCHTSEQTQNWCYDNFPNFIPKDKWPPNSPDLNPLDYSVWNEIVNSMKWNKVYSITTLKQQIKAAVKSISNETILHICQNWYKRVRSLQSNNGLFIQ
ncbi:hypothetical protein ABPG72_020015 [Tetrahymena utriculariae]